MSRSYKKHASGGVCRGSNTQYYRNRNKSTRNKNKHIIRNALKKYEPDEIDGLNFIENKRNPNYDCWREPTDGKWHARTFKEYLINSCINFLYNINDGNLNRHLENFNKYKRK